MPPYDGLGIGVERGAVVLDVGAAYTKCGFSGEPCPRFVIPSKSENLLTKKVSDLWSSAKEDLADILIDFIYHIYFRLLSVSPKDRRVVVCESLLCPTYFRHALAEVLFKHFEAPSILHLPAQQLPLYCLGVQSALVVDIGYNETTVLPFVEGIPLLGSWQSFSLGGATLHRNVHSLMAENSTLSTPDGLKSVAVLKSDITSKLLEDIAVRACFVRGPPTADTSDSSVESTTDTKAALPVKYPLDNDNFILIDGITRSQAADVMFTDNMDGSCLPRAILEAIVEAPLDCRKQLANNLVVVGGGCQLPGFQYRLLEELKRWVKTPCFSSKLSMSVFKIHENTVPANIMAWVGASIYSATGVLKDRSLSKDTYTERGKQLPDWTSLDPEYSATDALSWQKKRSIYSLPVPKPST